MAITLDGTTGVTAAEFDGALDASNLTGNINASQLTGALPAIDGSALTGIESGIGTGQSWQTVSRSAGTSYQNTTGKPIMIGYMNNYIVSYEPQVSTNNSTWIAVGSGDNSGGGQVPQQFIVPNGHYYRINTSSAGVKIWSELR